LAEKVSMIALNTDKSNQIENIPVELKQM